MHHTVLYILGRYPVWSETFLRQDLDLLLQSGVPLVPVALFSGDTVPRDDWPPVEVLSPSPAASGGSARFRSFLGRILPRTVRYRAALLRHRILLEGLVARGRAAHCVHVHAEFADLPGVLGGAAAARLGCSRSVGVHARDVFQCRYPPEVLFGGAAFLTVCNRAARGALLGRLPSCGDSVHLIHHGLRLEQWPFREEAAVHRPFRVVYVGRLVSKKGVSVLLRALRLALAGGFPVHLDVVGDGPLRGDLRGLAAEWGLHDAVSWHGVLTRSAVRVQLERADCLTAPSVVTAQGDRDGIPNVVLEGLALGTPVAASTVGGIPEVISDATGWPCVPGCPRSLVDAWGRIAEGGAAVDAKRRAGRKVVVSRFDAVREARRRAALFRAVCDSTSAGRKV